MWIARTGLGLRAVLRSSGLRENPRLPATAAATIHGSTTLADQDRIYTSEQREIVLEKLNMARTDQGVRTLLGAKLVTHVENRLEKHGNFTKLEELLQVQTIGPKTVRNVCDKLLGIASDIPKSPSAKSSSKKARTFVNLISPQLPEETRTKVRLLVTVVVDELSISWAHVDVKRKYLLTWGSTETVGANQALKDIIIEGSRIVSQIPDADLYILEEPAVGNMKSRNAFQTRSALTVAIATSLHTEREQPGDLKIAFVKNKLVEKHFEAVVGSETVSLQPYLQDIIDQKVVAGRSNLFVPSDLSSQLKLFGPAQREQLSRATLLALSTVDLVLPKGNFEVSETERANS